MNKDFIIKKNPLGDDIYLCAYIGNDKTVKVPEGVTFIRSFAFADEEEPNETITTIILPDTVNEVDTAAFAYCHSLETIIWPKNENFRIIGANLFEECFALKKIAIPKSILAIVNIILPKNLKTIELHDNLQAIGQSAFCYEENKNLYRNTETINILLSNPNYKIIDGFMVNVKNKTALFYVNRNKKDVSVPYGIETIGMYCFDEYGYFKCEEDTNDYRNTTIIPIETVELPETVKKLDVGAFYYCKNLEAVKYKGKEKDLDVSFDTFKDCDKIEDSDIKIICIDTRVKKKRQSNLMLERVFLIHKAIKSGSYPNSNDLQKLCQDKIGLGKCGISTISRDIDYLRNRFDAPIIYDYYQKGYVYEKPFELKLE